MRQDLPAAQGDETPYHFLFGNRPEAQAFWEERRSIGVQVHRRYGRHPPALGPPQKGTEGHGMDSCPWYIRTSQCKKRVCQPELSTASPKSTRVVGQPVLKKGLVTGAGTAEKDCSKQKAHQDDTG